MNKEELKKEAEEYTKNIFCNVNCSIGHPRARSVNLLDVEQAFKDGAEFGYNKANEWHYLSNKDYPKDKTEKKYLVALKSEYGGFFYEIDTWCESLHCFASNNPTKVYAWKEIVLPELKESE